MLVLSLASVLACATAGGATGNGGGGGGDGGGLVEVDCYPCDRGFCFELDGPAPVAAWLGNGTSWRLATDDGTEVIQQDGLAWVQPAATANWTECAAFVGE